MSASPQTPLIAVLFALLLSGCTGKVWMDIEPEKLVDCRQEIDFSNPGDVASDDPYADGSLRVTSNPEQKVPFTQRCLEEGGQKLAYAAFALPRGDGTYNLEVRSDIGSGVWLPKVRLYDANLRQTREIASSEFSHKSDETYAVLWTIVENWLDLQVPLRDEEKYAVVITDAAKLGQTATTLGLKTRTVTVKRTKSYEDCDGSGAKRRCKTRYREVEEKQKETYKGLLTYSYEQKGSLKIRSRRQP